MYTQLKVDESQKNFIQDLYDNGNITVEDLEDGTILTPEKSNVSLRVSKVENPTT